jgi:hypothetical protein
LKATGHSLSVFHRSSGNSAFTVLLKYMSFFQEVNTGHFGATVFAPNERGADRWLDGQETPNVEMK